MQLFFCIVYLLRNQNLYQLTEISPSGFLKTTLFFTKAEGFIEYAMNESGQVFYTATALLQLNKTNLCTKI